MLKYANPTLFLALAARLIPWLAGASALALGVGLYLTFFVAPDDYQQGDSVKIMYLHVPSAWLGMMCYMVMTSAALGTLVWRHPLADAAQKAAAPLGAAFTLLCLITGSLWGKPMWGTWWVWDARLTSELVLFLIYLGLIGLWQTHRGAGPGGARRRHPDPGRRGQYSHHQVFGRLVEHTAPAVVGVPPRRTRDRRLHAVDAADHGLGFTLLFFTLHLMAVRNEILRRRLRRLSILAASAEEPEAGRRRRNEGLFRLYLRRLWLRAPWSSASSSPRSRSITAS